MNNARTKQIKPPSVGAAIAKIAFGAMFVVVAFTESQQGVGYVITGLIMGAALIVWGVLGYKNGKKTWENYMEAQSAQAKSKVRVCPYCGARTSGSVCEYCGSPLD